MEGDRFDALTKTLTTTARSRRQTLAGLALGAGTTRRTLVAGLAALLPGVSGGRPAAAVSCNHTSRQCVPSLKCCNGECRRPQASTTALKCRPCPGCSNGRACVKIDKKHSVCQGEARGRCLPKAGCIGGAVCVPNGPGQSICACSGGLSACDGQCVDLHSDPQHCGSCLNQCLLGVTRCCAVGLFDQAECVDVQTDERHCGGCGQACPAGQVCLGGRCQNQCVAGTTRCGAVCVDLQSDAANCGGCGQACASGRACCGGQCRTVATDPLNCGGCGRVCPAGQPCANGGCGSVCAPYGSACVQDIDCCQGVPCNGNRCVFP